MPLDHFKVKAEGKLVDIAPKAPLEEGAEIRLELVEVGQHDITSGVGKLDGLSISVADASKLVGKKVKVRIERVLNGAAYATLVQTAAQTAKQDVPITAESEAEKPTRAPRKKKVEEAAKPEAEAVEAEPATERLVRDSGRTEKVPGSAEVSPKQEEAHAAEVEAEEPAVTDGEPPKPKKKTRRGSRGGRNRRKKPAAATAAENGQAEEAPTPATIHVPSPELGQTNDGAERGRRAAAEEEADTARLARRTQPA